MTEAIRGNVFALVAEMESKVSSNAEKASHADVEQEMVKKAIIEALQDIENSASDRLNGLNAIKNFLSHLAAQDLGADVNGYVKGELESANSYKPDQDLLNKLKQDQDYLKERKGEVEGDKKSIADLDRQIADLVKKVADAENRLKNGSFFERIAAFFEIAGLGVALGGLEVGRGVVWLDLKVQENDQSSLQSNVNEDNQALKNDPKLLSCLDFLSAGNKMVASRVNQRLSLYKSLINDVSEVEHTISAMVKLFHSA